MKTAHASGKTGPDLHPTAQAIADHAERGRLYALAGTDPWGLELRKAAHRLGRRHALRHGRVTSDSTPIVVVKRGTRRGR